MASFFENLLEPQRLETAVDSRFWLLVVSLLGTAAGGYVLFLLLRRLGPAGAGVERSEAVLAFPLALAAFALPSVFIIALGQPLPSGNPLTGALIQSSVAIMCLGALFMHPWRPEGEPRGEWFAFKPRQLIWVPLVWALAFPVMQLAMFSSGLLHEIVGAQVQNQEVVQSLRSRSTPGWIFAWYLMAVVAAPLMEEFVFRVCLFGGTRRLLQDISVASGWRHPGMWVALGFSVASFVIAHGVWSWTVGILPLTLLSVILTVLYAQTRSIWPGVLYHALHNAFVVTMQFFVLA